MSTRNVRKLKRHGLEAYYEETHPKSYVAAMKQLKAQRQELQKRMTEDKDVENCLQGSIQS